MSVFFILGGVIIKSKIKSKIICYILIACVSLTSISLSYSDSISIVHAESEYSDEFLTALIGVCLTIGGMTATGGVGAVITAVGVGLDIYTAGSATYQLFSDNGDGTITINGELIQAVIDEFEKYEKINGFSDGDTVINGDNRRYYISVKSMNCAHADSSGCDVFYNDFCSFDSNYRVGCYTVYEEWTTGKYRWDLKGKDSTFATICLSSVKRVETKIYSNGDTYKTETDSLNSNNSLIIYVSSNMHEATQEVHANFPIFSSADALTQYLKYGDNYKDALNYVERKPIARRASFYSPTYNGGSITINKNKLPNVINKIDELNNDNPDDTDTVINNFITWVYSNEGEPETETPIEPDTSEVGDNLTETNGWLQKIYNRIGDFINVFNTQKNNLNNLLESKFDELITAVKNIGKSDEPETENETETETETETSTDKTDIIIENQEKSQGILESILTAIQDGFKDTVNELKKIRRWTALDTVFDGLDAVADWLDFVTKFFDDVGTGVSVLAEGFTDTVTELTKVFPFSIPVTLTLIMDLLSAPPQVPKFELPIKIDHLGIDEKITIDLTEFGTISVISRTFLTIIYCVGLYHLSFKIVSAKKGA